MVKLAFLYTRVLTICTLANHKIGFVRLQNYKTILKGGAAGFQWQFIEVN